MKYLCLATLLLTSITQPNEQPKPIVIVMHGTWARDTNWYKEGGDFYEELRQGMYELDAEFTSFTWSGKLDNYSRRHAGIQLAELIHSFDPTRPLIITAHSHGVNVAIVASHILAQRTDNKHTIHTIFALGAPVSAQSYMPNMDIIQRFYNFYSFEDMVQPVLGMFDRIYPEHERITNIRVIIGENEPNHENMHNPLIGRWLYGLCAYEFEHGKTYIATFAEDTPAIVAIDTQREKLEERDLGLLHKIVFSALRKPEKSAKAPAF